LNNLNFPRISDGPEDSVKPVRKPTPGRLWRSERNAAIVALGRQGRHLWPHDRIAFVFDLTESSVKKIVQAAGQKGSRIGS
jgi:hypothetical protein